MTPEGNPGKLPDMYTRNDAIDQQLVKASLGPAMKALTYLQQRFVIAILDAPDADHTAAARLAGFADPGNSGIRATAHRVAHNPKVQAAIQEEARKRMNATAIMAVSNIIQLANDPTEKAEIRLKANLALMNRVGLHEKTETLNVHEIREGGDQAAIEKIISMAAVLGVDAKVFLGKAGLLPKPEVIDITPEAEPAAAGEPTLAGLEDLI